MVSSAAIFRHSCMPDKQSGEFRQGTLCFFLFVLRIPPPGHVTLSLTCAPEGRCAQPYLNWFARVVQTQWVFEPANQCSFLTACGRELVRSLGRLSTKQRGLEKC